MSCTAAERIVDAEIPAMKKSERIEAFVATLTSGEPGWDPCYAGWFRCFNAGDYYEAHDVLEQLWLRTEGADYAFYKGLIQLAGAFVHLKKQHARPWHPKDGRRLSPASRLFALALGNLSRYAPRYRGLDVAAVCAFAGDWRAALVAGEFRDNPWSPEALPNITLNER